MSSSRVLTARALPSLPIRMIWSRLWSMKWTVPSAATAGPAAMPSVMVATVRGGPAASRAYTRATAPVRAGLDGLGQVDGSGPADRELGSGDVDRGPSDRCDTAGRGDAHHALGGGVVQVGVAGGVDGDVIALAGLRRGGAERALVGEHGDAAAPADPQEPPLVVGLGGDEQRAVPADRHRGQRLAVRGAGIGLGGVHGVDHARRRHPAHPRVVAQVDRAVRGDRDPLGGDPRVPRRPAVPGEAGGADAGHHRELTRPRRCGLGGRRHHQQRGDDHTDSPHATLRAGARRPAHVG